MEAGKNRPCCCTPGNSKQDAAAAPAEQTRLAPTPAKRSQALARDALLSLEGGPFRMGNDWPDGFAADGEGPSRMVELAPFAMAATTVSNREFAAFVRATQYVTEAEQAGQSYVFHLQVAEAERAQYAAVAGLPWWLIVDYACWQRPQGPGSQASLHPGHPVVHVSWNDALAYCQWADVRLPSEAEWEYAARGGVPGQRMAWGNDLYPEGERVSNTWWGNGFPDAPHHDWHPGTVAVDAFAANGFGLYNVCGNVWEWCADFFHPDYHQSTSTTNPLDQRANGQRSMRGGSFLCHDSYCNRYRVAARSSNTPNSSASNIGFRVARS